MKYYRVAMLAGAAGLVFWMVSGCTDINQLTDPNPAFETLVVAYGHPGPSADPCDDVLPQIDGVIQDQEWALAEPRFVRMTGMNGNGGRDFYLEIRAVWTDDGKLGGSDRLFLMIRFEDDDFDSKADQLAYVKAFNPLESCETDVVIENMLYCLSPSPIFNPGLDPDLGPTRFDQVILDPDSWTRFNQDGREDQVVVMITQVNSPEDETGLTELTGEILGLVGPEVPVGKSVSGANTDVWIWRAGRTNMHPVPQYAEWDVVDLFNGVPDPVFSRFTNNSGFCEDVWIDGNGLLQSDDGLKPFIKNFERIDPVTGETFPNVPIKLTECPPLGREPSEEELKAQNGGVPKDLGLWWPTARAFRDQDTLACSRISSVGTWSRVIPPNHLLSGEYDKIQGWGMQVPYLAVDGRTSGRDVRAKGTYETTQEKGFGVHSLEIMRDLDTGQSDDILIDPSNPDVEYRIVIGVFDRSGQIGSGSTEIRLKFESIKAKEGGPLRRC